MNTHNLAHRYGTEAEGIIVPQVVLGSKRQFYNIIYTVYVIGSNSQFLHFLTIKRSVMIHTLHSLLRRMLWILRRLSRSMHSMLSFQIMFFVVITIINGCYQYSCKVNKKFVYLKDLPNIAASKKRK